YINYFLVANSTKLFSIILTTGTIIKKCAKYNTVDICPTSINGVSTCFAPICINTKKLATNIKNAILLKGLNCTPLNLDKSVKGIAIKAKIAANIAITPNNLLGIDLNIA
ncbi:MAG UNVERIFIED_CONTAM: hypothetical protein MIO30_32675, partial [Methylobacterium ajmalii]